jgi:hypothetical protein
MDQIKQFESKRTNGDIFWMSKWTFGFNKWRKVGVNNSGFDGLVVSMLPSGTQVRGFMPGRSRRIFRGVKILGMPYLGG